MRMNILVSTVAAALATTTWASHAQTVDFESFALGTVNLQGGWTVEDEFGNGPVDAGDPPFDEEVADESASNRAWRASNAVTSGGFSAQPYSHTAPEVAGESDAALYNDRGTDHTNPLRPPNPGAFATTPFLHTGFRFKSTTGAPQSGLGLSVSPSAKQSAWRVSFLSISDDGSNGFDINFVETGTLADPFGAGSSSSEIASDLSYTDWHTVDIFIEFVDDLDTSGTDTVGNDIVRVLVNGQLVHTGTTWETFYHDNNPAGLTSGTQVQAADSLMFALRGSAASGTAGEGIFFDDVVIDNASLETFACVGVEEGVFEPPMDEPVSLRRPNRVMPLKMSLFDELDMEVTDFEILSAPVVEVDFLGSSPTGDEVPATLDSTGKGDEGNTFQFDGTRWAFNLKTTGFSAAGEYEITVASGDTSEYLVSPTCTATFFIE